MTQEKFWLVTDTTAAELEQKTGLQGHDTPRGVLLKAPKPFRLDVAMERLDRALHPRRCTCGSYAIIHQPNCPAWLAIT